MISGLYEIANIVTGECYVGRTVNARTRWRAHRNFLRRGDHPNKYLQAAWNKYGEAAFKFVLAVECHPERAIALEQFLLDAQIGKYNLSNSATSAVRVGERRSPDTIAKMSKAMRGIKLSPERVEKTAAWNRGRKRAPETIAKMSAANRGEKNPRYGKTASAETRAKMRAAHLGKRRDAASCARMAEAKRDYHRVKRMHRALHLGAVF